MLLDTLLARATGMPEFELWRGLAPRRFFIDDLLVEVIKATEVLPADNENGIFAVISTSPLGLPGTLPPSWAEVDRLGDYFATFRAPVGTTPREVIETLALELVPLFYPSKVYEKKLFSWLEKEIGSDQDEEEEEEGELPEGPVPDAPGPLRPVRCIDIPSPSSYRNPKSEEEQDLDFLYGSGSTPPQYHGYDHGFSGQHDPSYGPPDCYETNVQQAEEDRFYFA